MTAFQRATTMANLMPAAERSPSRATGFAFYRVGPGPEAERVARLRLDGEDARFPVGLGDGREARDGAIAALRAEPGCGGLMHGVERRDFDQDIGGGRELAIDKFEVAERGQKRGAAELLFFLPSFAGRKAERGKEAGQPVVGRCAAGGTQKEMPLIMVRFYRAEGGIGRGRELRSCKSRALGV